MVTKYQFSELLKEAWQRTMTPSKKIAGFRRYDVFPLNPDAIDCSVSASNPEATLQLQNQNGDDEGDNENAEEINDCGDRDLAISAEEQQLFQRRLEEGYNLPDAEYMRWLRIHHPESLPPDGEAPLPNLPLDEWKIDDRQESLANGDRQESLANDDRQESLADLYSSVRPASPLTMTNGPEMEVAGVSMDETSAFPVSLPLGSGGTHDTTQFPLSLVVQQWITNNFRMH